MISVKYIFNFPVAVVVKLKVKVKTVAVIGCIFSHFLISPCVWKRFVVVSVSVLQSLPYSLFSTLSIRNFTIFNIYYLSFTSLSSSFLHIFELTEKA